MHARTALLPLLLTAALGGCSDFSTAPARTPAEIRVTPDTAVLLTGETAEFQVELLDESGTVYDVVPAWAGPLLSSDRPERVTIEGTRVTALDGGENVLQVELAGVAGEAVLRANPREMGVSVAMAHITQGVQRRNGSVPLVAGRRGLLRVAVIGDDENFYRPTVRATFLDGATVVHTADMTVEHWGLPLKLEEGELRMTFDASIPGSVLQPGVGLVLEIDPDGIVPASAGSTLRVPAEGAQALNIQAVPPFRLMMVPVTLAANANRESRLTPSYAEGVTRLTKDIFPLGDVQVEVREPYITQARMDTDNGWYQLIDEIAVLRYDDGNPHYYYGGFNRPPGTGIAGLGFVGYPVAIGMDNADDVIAHEIGHTLDLPHAPCGGPANPDPNYPSSLGWVGNHGWDATSGRILPDDHYDLMSYCDPIWISDYNYERVLAYRDTSDFDAAFEGAALRAADNRVLLVRGGIREGRLRLEPALEWTGQTMVPRGGGRYTLEGLDASGGVLFSVPFEPRTLDHGGAQFLMALPESMARTDRLETLRVRGPEGSVERRRSASAGGDAPRVRLDATGPGSPGLAHRASIRWDAGQYPLAVVRESATGRIRAMSRTGDLVLPDGDPDRFEVVVSDGVRSRAARVVPQ